MTVSQEGTRSSIESAPRPEAAAGTEGFLPGVNLLIDLAGLTRLLEHELQHGSGLDAFLLAAGINQILEDHLHRDYLQLRKATPYVRRLPPPLGPTTSVSAGMVRRFGVALRRLDGRERRALGVQRRLSQLVQLLATALVDQADTQEEARGMAAEVLADLGGLSPRLLHQLGRQPTSFRSLDQHPADLGAIAERFSERFPDRSRSLLVMGVRTSGSYLAPMYRSYLARLGYRDVRGLTIRPQDDCLPWEIQEIHRLVLDGGLLLVADDPPKSGAALARCLTRLERMQVPRGSIVLLLPLLEDDSSLPPSLVAYQSITLDWTESEMHRRLSPPELQASLGELLTGRTIRLSPPTGDRERITVESVLSARPLPLPPVRGFQVGSPQRRHSRALVQVRLREAASGREFDHHVYAKGVGLGYFGDHARVVAQALQEFFPELYGLRDGVLFRSWLADHQRVDSPDGPDDLQELADRIGSYVYTRHRRLAVNEDPTARSGGVQEQVVKLVGRSFGRLAFPSRVLLRPWTRRLLRVRSASVIDGSMSVGQWFRVASPGPSARTFLKVDYDERAFSNQDTVVDELYSYDPIFDLAGAATDFAIRANEPSLESCFEDRLRLAFEGRTRTPVPDERWLLYQLVHANSHVEFLRETLQVEQDFARRAGARVPSTVGDDVAQARNATRRAMARFEQRYLAHKLMGDLVGGADGPLCAIDVDGVLETAIRGYSSSTPTGVLSLRALIRHGYRPVLATGRSLDEVRDRCVAYHLQGGVAEYGAVVYDHLHDRVIEVLTDGQRERLEQLRSALSRFRGVQIDAGYRRSIRASFRDGSAARRKLPAQLVEEVLGEHGLAGDVRVVPGYLQTDFITAAVDKATGLRLLLQALGPGETADAERPLALAVGDTEWDLPMLRMALTAIAPANADGGIRAAGIEVVAGDCQRGLARAVGRLLGHPPGGCPVCSPPPLDRESALLFTVLSAQGGGRWIRLHQGCRLAAQLLAEGWVG